MGDAREDGRDGVDSAFLGPPAGDPVDILEASDRPRRRLGIRRLAVVDDRDAADAADLLHPVGQAGKIQERLRQPVGREPAGPCRCEGRRGVLPVVRSGQCCRLRKVADRLAILVKNPLCDGNALARSGRHGHRHHLELCPLPERLVDGARDRIVDADDGSPEPAGAENLALRVDVGRHGSVTVEMVRSDIQEDADVEGRLDGQIELVGGELEDEGPVAWHRRKIEGGGPQIAADPNVAGAGRTQQMTDERRRRRFAVGAGDADVAGLRQRAPEELDIADQLDASIVGGNDGGV